MYSDNLILHRPVISPIIKCHLVNVSKVDSPGCNTESGQTMMLTQFEPIIPQEALMAAGYDLVALGHIHRRTAPLYLQ